MIINIIFIIIIIVIILSLNIFSVYLTVTACALEHSYFPKVGMGKKEYHPQTWSYIYTSMMVDPLRQELRWPFNSALIAIAIWQCMQTMQSDDNSHVLNFILIPVSDM